jgi:hypothetical protein
VYFEAAFTARHHVETTVRVAFEHTLHAHGATDVDDAAFLRENDAKLGAVALRFPDHFAVSGLKNMQRQFAAREDDQLQGEGESIDSRCYDFDSCGMTSV